jgi:hypothetical protein
MFLSPKDKQKQRGCLLQKLVFETYSFSHVGSTDILVDLTSNLNNDIETEKIRWRLLTPKSKGKLLFESY